MDYVDARQVNQFFPPDPRFTELPILRRADFLWTRVHKRHLDAERHIASALNRRLLHRHTEVERIDVFTMLDACRSCGGFVLPRSDAVARVRDVKIRSFTAPGQALELEAHVQSASADGAQMKLAARADGRTIAAACIDVERSHA